MKIRLFILLGFMVTRSISINAQSMVGFWTVDQVIVGDRNLTPVAKWFKYHNDNTYQAGNGWTQNDIGTWKYDKTKEEFLPESKNGKDEYGPFKVGFTDEKMTWERIEDEMLVSVSLSKIFEMPMSPKDSIIGNWILVEVNEGNKDLTKDYVRKTQELLDIWWTGTYHKTNPDSTKSHGYWYMDPHAPVFHMIDFNKQVDLKQYNVSFNNDLVIMKLKSDQSLTLTYKRK